MGHPVLRERAKPVEKLGSAELRQLVQDMKDTMAAKNGAGLAAPQIGVGQRVVIFGVQKNPRYPDAEEVPFTVLVNPRLVMLSREVEEDWEGCLSVPGLRGDALALRRAWPVVFLHLVSCRGWCGAAATAASARPAS